MMHSKNISVYVYIVAAYLYSHTNMDDLNRLNDDFIEKTSLRKQ